MTPEKKIENKIKEYLTQNTCWHFKHHADATMARGIPDIIACYRGYFVGIEVKQENGVQSDQQKAQQRAIEHSGGTYILTNSFTDFLDKWLKFIVKIIEREEHNASSC